MKCDSEQIEKWLVDRMSELREEERKLRDQGHNIVADMKHEAIFELQCIFVRIKSYESVS